MKSFKESLKIYNTIFKNNKLPIQFYCKSHFFFYGLLGERIITKTKINIKSIAYLLFCLIVTLRSLITLLKVLIIKKNYIAHFQIGIKNSDDLFYDIRSDYIIKKISLNNTINFVYSSSSKFIILSYFKYPNPIFIKEIYYLITFFKNFKKKESEAKKFAFKRFKYQKKLLSQYSYFVAYSEILINFLNDLLPILKIKKFIFIDDTRYINELIVACKNNRIKTIGYMQGRINEYHVGLKHIKFDIYLCWSKYFKDKILTLNNQYRSKDIIIIGHPYWREYNCIKNSNLDKKNILIIGETSVNYKYMVEFIKNISNNKNFNLFFRDKPGFNVLKNFKTNIFNDKIIIDNTKNIYESFKKNRINIVVGTLSTVLLESWIFGIPSIIIKNPYDYGSHIYNDRLSDLVNSPKNINQIIRNNLLLRKHFIKKRCNKIWDSNNSLNNQKRFNNVSKDISLN